MKFKLSKETVKNLRDNIAAFNTGKNSVRFEIGMKNGGKGLMSRACIVKDGQQIVIGFLTLGVPGEWEEGKSETFAVKANMFCDYIGKLLPFDADFNFDVTGKGVKVSLPGTATVSLSLVDESDCEPLIPSDEGDAYIAVEQMKSSAFMALLKKGGYLAKLGDDMRNITNHVAFAFINGNMITMSSDGNRIARAVKPVSVKYNELMNALLYFEQDARGSYVARVQKGELSAEDYFKEAAAKGYHPNVAGVSLPVSAIITLLKLSGYGEELNIMVTPRNMHVMTGNIKLCLSLGVAVWTSYANFINSFDSLTWSKAVVDKDSLLNALSIAELACQGKKRPVVVDFTEKGILIKDCSGNKVKVSYVEGTDGIAGRTACLNCSSSIETLSKFSGGNIVIGCIDESKPVMMADGAMDGADNVSKTYLMQVTVSDDEEEEEEEKEEKKPSKKTSKKSASSEEAGSTEETTEVPTEDVSETEEAELNEDEGMEYSDIPEDEI